ncbi:hypothetical protein [Nonomuraea sp. GTA35]|uniref:hypothetical protein n=1 Tax=Nonomuraea sp. GTA35 TaxID=1676746 RepID=UPI0035C23349
MHPRKRRIPLLLAGLAVVTAASAGCATGDQNGRAARSAAERQAEIAAKSRQVMDLERAMHRFAKTGTGGAQITYTTSDASLIKALHAWFDAQVSDHGRHAEHG